MNYMKKDKVYSMRMSSEVLVALKKSAYKDRRTVVSLLDKIILDHLEKEGFLLPPYLGKERRRFPRKKITLSANLSIKADSKFEARPVVILNISEGGVLITYPNDLGEIISVREPPHFELSFQLPHTHEQIHFPCDARRLINDFSEIHIGASFVNHNEEDLRKLRTYLM